MLSRKALKISASPTLVIDSKAKEMKSQGIDVISFGAGEPDFDTPLHIREAAFKAINEGHTRYTPAAGTPALKKAICEKLKRDNSLEYSPAQIVVSNGAKHSLSNTLAALLNPGDEVMIPAPYWVSYPEMVSLNDGIPVIIDTGADQDFKVTLSDLEKSYSSKCKAFMLNSPSNPTGQIYSEAELKMIAEFCCNHNIYIVADEIYENLIYGDYRHVSIASLNEKTKDLTIVVNGVSKSYAMTGWRIGYTASAPDLAAVMSNFQSQVTSCPNSISQAATITALSGPQECVEEMRLAFEERNNYMHERIQAMPYLDALKSHGAFYIFADITKTAGKKFNNESIDGSDSFSAFLLENQKVAVVPGTGFGAPNYIRLSFATSMENIVEGMNRIEEFVRELR